MAQPKTAVKIRGRKKLIRNLARIGKKYPQAALKALFMEGERLRALAIPRTPKDIGILRQSAFVLPRKTPNGQAVTVGYGGGASAYAEIQHERTDFKHTEGEAKFLEKAFDELQKDHLERLGSIIKAEVRKINLERG
jgi:hypothetical protein